MRDPRNPACFTQTPSGSTGKAEIFAPAASKLATAPTKPGFSMATLSPGLMNTRVARSSASCMPETMVTCSAVQFTPRDAFR